MFKNLLFYKIADASKLPLASEINEKLLSTAFVPCGATQELSYGFIPPREVNGLLCEPVNGQYILRFIIETKSVPGSVIAEKAQEAADLLQKYTGRKPGKKEIRDIKDEVKLRLLPAAFPKKSAFVVWIDPKAKTLGLDCASVNKGDHALSVLVDKLGVALHLINTNTSPSAWMTQLLLSDDHEYDHGEFSVERECLLKSTGEDAATIKFTRHNLNNDEIRKHIKEGKLPTELAFSRSGRIGFVLTESLRLKKIQLLDLEESNSEEAQDRFDADATIYTSELGVVLRELIEALGGEMTASQEE